MRGIRRFSILVAAAVLILAMGGTADAFWGFGDSGQQDKSGLDLERGYDRNTVVKITGPVAVPPRPVARGLIAFEMNLQGERIVVVLGPAWYLQDDNLDWKVGDQVTVRGSLARGKDGRAYLLSQQITTPGGTAIELRGQTGNPSWSGGFRGGQHGRGTGGQVQRGGSAGGRRGR
ncbi:MAG: hypothetical protein IH628_02420 [Proteobacteria bacterium]|nr:hypothetical protein [Pseudomonadota bacterium]